MKRFHIKPISRIDRLRDLERSRFEEKKFNGKPQLHLEQLIKQNEISLKSVEMNDGNDKNSH